MTVLIRPFRDPDRPAVIALWSEAFPDEPAHNASSEMIDRKLRVQPGLFLVAEKEGNVVGSVMAGFDGVRGWLHRLAVLRSARRGGVGTMLVKAAEIALREVGCPKLNLQVRSTNSEVIAFYGSLGYAIEQRVSMGRKL
jgi:ribosomal protein S18 acetylase RimI-like enzyme